MSLWRRVAGMLAALPFLVGCGTVEIAFRIGADERVDYDLRVEVQQQVIDRNEALAESLQEEDLCSMFDIVDSWFPGATEVAPTQREGYAGCLVRGGEDIETLVNGSQLRESGFEIRHQDDRFGFHWPGMLGSGSSAQLDSFAFSVTFPGEVLEHSGASTVSGTTVTWSDPNDLFSEEGLVAVGRDTPSLWTSLGRWALYAAGLTAVLAVAGLVWRRRSRPAGVQAPSGDEPGTPAEQPAEPAVDPVEERQFWGPPAETDRWEIVPPQAWAPQPGDLIEPSPSPGELPSSATEPQPLNGDRTSSSVWAPPELEEPPAEGPWGPPTAE